MTAGFLMPENATTSAVRPGCLLVIPEHLAAPLELIDGLRRRGIFIRETADGPSALVELLERSYLSMILVEPAWIDRVQDLISAARQYCPAVRIWRYDPSARPPLDRVDGTGQEWTQPESRPEVLPLSMAREPATRPEERGPAEKIKTPAPAADLMPSVQLTDEELAMLLEDFPDPQAAAQEPGVQ